MGGLNYSLDILHSSIKTMSICFDIEGIWIWNIE